MVDRFHRAARDGYLEVLKGVTKKDCNLADEDGVTPTACAAHQGNLEALRILVGRGGDPEKCDYYGNTSLHCAAARGHMNCASFLVNFGVSLWTLDNELHTAKDLAAINNKDDVLRYLDEQEMKQDQKKAKKLQERARKDAEKRLKENEKMQRKEEEREKIDNLGNLNQNWKKNIFDTISRTSLSLLKGQTGKKEESKPLHRTNAKKLPPKFSDLTRENSSANKTILSGIQKRIMKKKTKSETDANIFKVRQIESDGKSSVRSLSGLQRDSEILFVPSGSFGSDSPSAGKRGKLSEVFTSDTQVVDRVSSELKSQGSIFDRPGFGSVAFRNSVQISALNKIQHSLSVASSVSSRQSSEDLRDTSIDSQDSQPTSMSTAWEDEQEISSLSEEGDSSVYFFLVTNGLQEYLTIFTKEHIDLEALMVLTEEDLEGLELPMGPRKKLAKALAERKKALRDPGEVTDVRL